MSRLRMASVVTEFHRIADARPAAVAVHGPDGGRVRYGELGAAVDQTRDRLRAVGVRPGTTVRVAGRVDAGTIAAAFGTWELGGVVWLVESVPAGEPTDGLPGGLVARSGLGCEPRLDIAPLTELERQVATAVAVRPPGPGGRPAYVVASSGTTGRPKHVLGSDRGLDRFVGWQRDTFGIGPGDGVAHLTPVMFDVVLRELVTPLVSGATVVLPPAGLGPARVLEHLAASPATVLNVVPSVARMWLDAAAREDAVPARTGLRLTFFAGEALDGALAERWRRVTAVTQAVVNLYGPAETTLAAFWWSVPDEPAPLVCPVGAPLPGVSFSLDRAGRPPDAPGEVVIRTPYGSLGYLGPVEPDRAAAYQSAGGVVTFRTGDLGRRGREGLELVGRLGTVLKVNGRWVDRAAVEAVLRSCDGIAEAVVLPTRTARGVRLRAFVTGSSEIDRAALRAEIRRSLGTAAVPASIDVVAEFPRLRTGKLALAQLVRTDPDRPYARGETMPDSSTAPAPELVLAVVTSSAGRILCTDVAPGADLFDLGLDSLTALELSALVEAACPVECSPDDIFDHPVPSDLARVLAGRSGQAG